MRPDAGSDARQHDRLRTSCGRDLAIGRLALGNAVHPARRVFIDLGERPDRGGSAWAALSVAEARRLAAMLLFQVASHCTVHNTLRRQPDVGIELARTVRA
jgi:hypothetical protein